MRGRFITFEGGEGVGKSTQIARLAASLEARGFQVETTREPGGCPASEEIRSLLVAGDAGRWDGLSEALLHYTARREHLLRRIMPALDTGRWVLCDRFSDSTMAYQGYGHELGPEAIEKIELSALGDIPAKNRTPDLTLILDLAIGEGLDRATARAGDETRYESLALSFHERVRLGFLEIAKSAPQRCEVIAANGDQDAVAARVFAAVDQHLLSES